MFESSFTLLFWFPGALTLLTLIAAFASLMKKKRSLYLPSLYACYFSAGTSLLILWDALFTHDSSTGAIAFIFAPRYIIVATAIGVGLGVWHAARNSQPPHKLSTWPLIPVLLMPILLFYGLLTSMG